MFVIIDNTWLSSALFNPFSHGADYVVLSLAKYYSGGAAIAGAILTKDQEVHKTVSYQRIVDGCHVCPAAALAVTRNLGSLDARVRTGSDKTHGVLAGLKAARHPKICDIRHAEAKGESDLIPSVFTILLKVPSVSRVRKILPTGRVEYKTSFGGFTTRFDPFPHKEGEGFVRVRVAIGFDPNELVPDIVKNILDVLDAL